jgi:hypothetical protein
LQLLLIQTSQSATTDLQIDMHGEATLLRAVSVETARIAEKTT